MKFKNPLQKETDYMHLKRLTIVNHNTIVIAEHAMVEPV